MECNQESQRGLDLLKNGKDHLFITGKAGTGKSTLLQQFLQNNPNFGVVLAPTGVAALHVKGVTIHSFFGFRPGITPKDASIFGKRTKQKIYSLLKMIVIDEISMVRADLLDCIDAFLRSARANPLPFGGVRMVFVGDLHQLPPVVTADEREFFSEIYASPYFFSSKVMENVTFSLLELKTIHRQKDPLFIDVLNAVRTNTVTDKHLSWINQAHGKQVENSIYLSATLKEAESFNRQALEKLSSEEKSFEAEVEGDFEPKMAPTEPKLSLKKGAQVMFLVNDPEGRWVNGSLGKVVGFEGKNVLVEKQEGDIVEVSSYKWTLYKYQLNEKERILEQKEVGAFIQYPLCLAWAITIHKSQGKTFHSVIVDLSRSFAPGQAYVALSRCSSFDGLCLKKPLRASQIRIDPIVLEYTSNLSR